MAGDTRRAIVIGATGAVGSALVRELLASPRCAAVTIVTRRPVGSFTNLGGAAKLTQRLVDMDRVELQVQEPARGCDLAFCTMGIGQPRKVSREELWRVDVEYAVRFARACRVAGVSHMSLLTAVGAKAGSHNFYLKTKGAVEQAFVRLAFPRLSLFRPGVLVTRETRYGLQDWITQLCYPLLSPLLPARFHEIGVEDLARAMRLNGERADTRPVEILHYPEFVSLLRSRERL